ncbi:hypothetical protein [Aquisalibacillus elongatus]|uniref:ABC-2 family transporter n=1 Tax=Aquisalibacillus elongatus TaxID=485577 RepID=A0A3N5C9M2_9BACI|nr:hypothetical protein [Aquisalibacillus elongatus]RPF55285.1 hypothetical protein EDC24_0156 [Aquisalibacillus elongatus]
MRNFLKLTNFEFNRISKLLFSLMGFVLLIQLIGVFFEVWMYNNRIDSLMTENQMTEAQALNQVGELSFAMVMYSMFFLGPIFISVGAMLFYIFLIWYREWFGKNTFIYRLLMLPTERINIFFSKLVTIVVATLTLVGFQFLALLIENSIFNALVSDPFLSEMNVVNLISQDPLISMIFPHSLDGILLVYGFGAVIVGVLFTAILLERSYRIKGIAAAILYAIVVSALLASPFAVNELLLNGYMYPGEILFTFAVMALLVLMVSIVISRKLLNDKIRV